MYTQLKKLAPLAVTIGIVFLFAFGIGYVEAQCGVTELCNPLGTSDNEKDIRWLVGRIIKGVLGVTGVIALAMLIWGGLLMLTSQGKKENYEQGLNTILWAAIGLVVIFGSYAIVELVLRLLSQTTT